MRRHGRTDGNQARIVKALLDVGFSVQLLSAVGDGCPDIAVGARCRNFFFEIKDPEAQKSDRALRPTQKKWHGAWKGQVAKIETVEEALEIIQRAFK